MISRNKAEASEGSIAAINSGSGNQHIDNRTTIQLSGGMINLAKTAEGAIIFDPMAMREAILSIESSLDDIYYEHENFEMVDLVKKNKLNGLTQEFYDEFVSINYEPYFTALDNFLKQRENEDLQNKVHKIVSVLNRKIFIKRPKFDTFEELLSNIEDALLDSEFTSLQGKEHTISFFLYYLYAICLLGKKTDEEKHANAT